MSQRMIAGLGTLLLLFTFLNPGQSKAQGVLTLEEAIAIGLEKNYGIQISKNTVEQAENNHSLGNAGFLPVIDAEAQSHQYRDMFSA